MILDKHGMPIQTKTKVKAKRCSPEKLNAFVYLLETVEKHHRKHHRPMARFKRSLRGLAYEIKFTLGG